MASPSQPQQDAVQGTGNAPEPSGELEQSIAGTEVWVTAQRRAEDLASALERRGAAVTIASTLAVQRRIDEATLVERTRGLIGRTPDIVVVTTGFGLRDWLETAASNGLGEGVATLLAGTRVIARGPKGSGALQQAGLEAAWVAPSESSREILDVLRAEGVDGRRIAVQLDGVGDPELLDGLREAGADVVELPVYQAVAAADPQLVARTAQALAGGRFDAVAFTSAPGARGWLDAVREQDLTDSVRERTTSGSLLLASVGPQTAEPLLEASMRTIWPDRGRLGALIRLVVTELSARSH